MNKLLVFFFFLGCFFGTGQEIAGKKLDFGTRFPVFEGCKTVDENLLEKCFYGQIQDFVYQNFVVPTADDAMQKPDKIKVLFEVNQDGYFKVIYVNASSDVLVQETQRVFKKMPQIVPPTYSGKPTYVQYNLTITIPLKSANDLEKEAELAKQKDVFSFADDFKRTELDSIVYKKYDNLLYKSHLNIPFSHSFYAHFDANLNVMGSNNHTAAKPYTYAEVSKYYNFEQENTKIAKNANNWWARKFWNENTVEIAGDGYWFVFNPIVDVQLGKSSGNEQVNTFVNTRGINVSGQLGRQFDFSTTIYESQGRFAGYYNNYIQSIKPAGGNPAILPGIGIAKEFKTNGYDFPLAEANLQFSPSRFFNLQLGYGRNFTGDGYRSLLESDGSSPYPFIKINTTFWKIKYTNTYKWLKDVRPEVTVDRTYATKFMANHYLSWNINNRLNIGFFESVVWANTNDRGFDLYFVNPIIFYRAVEFSASSRTGNALLGLTYKYKYNNRLNLYGQFLLDEFSLGDVKKREQSWKNKFAYQLGAKYFNAFGVNDLLVQLEYNHIRPYVYSHSEPITNYGHTNQSMAHQWGGNAKELLLISRYHKGRIFADAKFTYGIRGLDFAQTGDKSNYGGAIYRDYDENRYADTQVKVGQGNETKITIADFQAGYLINPSSNLKLFGSFIYRNFVPKDVVSIPKETTTWFSLGIRSDVFNWYFDY